MNKIKLIYGLVAVVIVLILLNVGIDLTKKFSDEKPPLEHKKSELEKIVFTELNNFGIQENWISKKRIWQNAPDSTQYYYKITVPSELTIPEILLHIKKEFDQYQNVSIDNEEYKINGVSQLQISSNNKVKFRAHFSYDNDVKRIRPNVSFIVGNIDDLAESEKEKLFEISYPCALMLVPSKKTKKILETLPDYDKDFVILINDDVSDEFYEMDSGSSKSKIKRSIGNIVTDFSGSTRFFVDQNSDLFNSVVFNYIKDEFRRRKITLYRLSTLKNVSKKSEKEKLSFLQYHFNDVENRKKKVFYITSEDYIKLQSYIEKYKKKGNKFVPLSEN